MAKSCGDSKYIIYDTNEENVVDGMIYNSKKLIETRIEEGLEGEEFDEEHIEVYRIEKVRLNIEKKGFEVNVED